MRDKFFVIEITNGQFKKMAGDCKVVGLFYNKNDAEKMKYNLDKKCPKGSGVQMYDYSIAT